MNPINQYPTDNEQQTTNKLSFTQLRYHLRKFLFYYLFRLRHNPIQQFPASGDITN
jgi:hypothetical protein